MKKKKSAGKIIAIIAIVLVVVLVLAVAGVLIYVNSLMNRIDRTESTENPSLSEEEVYAEEPTYDMTEPPELIEDAKQDYENIQDEDIKEEAHIENILLVGSDRRSTAENGRADSIMILSINHTTKKLHLTSLMRACYVCIPRSSGDTWGMLNASYSWGGPSLLIKTIENNFRIKIDHYVAVDFASFEKAVDIVGGVRLELTAGEASYLRLGGKGTYTLDGEKALEYARIRKIDNDFVRTSRQRKVISALLNQAKTMDLGKLNSLATSILPYVKTDLTNDEIFGYLLQAPTLLTYPMDQRMLPVENEDGKHAVGKIYVNGREMYKIDFETNLKALHEFIES